MFRRTVALVLSLGCVLAWAAPAAFAFDLPDLPTPGDLVVSGVKSAVERAGLSSAVSQLKGLLSELKSELPLLSDLGDPLLDDLGGKSRAALARLSKFTRLLKPLRSETARKLIHEITTSAWWRAIPDGGCSFEIKGLARALIYKKGNRAGLFLGVDGPHGIRALVGFSNANPLLGGFDDGRMDNPGEVPVAVLDLSRKERDYLQARVGLGELPPLSVRGKKTVEIGGQYFEVSLGMFDPGKTKVELTFSAGLKGTVDYLAEGELSAELELGVEVSPHRALVAAAAVRKAMSEKAAQVGLGKAGHLKKSRSGERRGEKERDRRREEREGKRGERREEEREGGRGEGQSVGAFTPSREDLQKLGQVLRAGLDALAALKTGKDDESLGEASLGLKLSLEGGLGIWDTKLPVATLETGVSVSVPLEAMIAASAGLVADFVDNGAKILPFMLRVSGLAVAGRKEPPTPEETRAFAEGAKALLRGALQVIGRLARESSLELSAELSMLGEESGSGGKGGGKGGTGGESESKADTNVTLVSASVELPIGEALDRAIENGALVGALRALARMAALGHPALDAFSADDPRIFKEVAATLVKGATFDLEVGAPFLPGLTVEYETSGADLLEAFSGARRGGREILSAMKSGLHGRSLGKLAGAELRGALRELFGSKALREGSFTLAFGLGTDFDIGAEGAGSLGLGATGFAEANPEFFLLWLGERAGRPDAVGQAALGLDVEVSLEGEISAGEGVELSAGAGGTLNLSPLRIEFAEMSPPPVTEVTVAGFRVTNFSGSRAPDGSFSGSGKLHLPVGPTVAATFEVDKNGHVVRGTWSGNFTRAGETFQITAGTLDDNGLHWDRTVTLPLLGSTTLHYTWKSDGSFSAAGSGSYKLAGSPVSFTLALDSDQKTVRGTFDGALSLFGRSFGDAHLTLNAQGIAGTARLNLGSGQGVVFHLSVSPNGAFSAAGTGTFNLFGFTFENAALTLTSNKLSGTGRLALGSALSADAAFEFAGGAVSGSIANLTLGGFGFREVAFQLGPSGFSGSGKAALPLLSNLAMSLGIASSGAISGSGSGNLTLAGFPLSSANLSLSNGQINGSGTLTLPGGSQGALAFTIASNGSVQGSMNGTLSLLGWTLSETSFSLSNQKLSGSGKVRLPGGSDAAVSAEIAAGGAFSAQGSGAFRIANRDVSEGNFSISNQGFSGTGKISILGAHANFTLQAQSSGTVSGSAGGDLTLPLPGGKSAGLKETALTLSSDGTIGGTGKLALANHTLSDCTFTARTDGTLSGKGKVQIGSQKVDCDFSISPSGGISLSGSASASASKSVSFGISSATISLSASVSLSVHNANELKASASGTASGKIARVSKSASVSGEVNLASGEFSVSVFGKNVTFDLF